MVINIDLKFFKPCKLNRNLNLDLLRVISTICIVIMHIMDFYIVNYNKVGIIFWNYINIIESLIRFAVPVFFMISGVLLLKNHKEKAIDFYKKRCKTVIVPYILISILYSIGNQILKTKTISISIILHNIYEFNAHYHLWFFKPLIILYLFVPLMRKIILYIEKNNKIIFINIYLAMWIIIGICIPSIINIINFDNKKYSADIIHYFGYFLLGYVIDTHYKKFLKNKQKFFVLIYTIAVLCTIIGNYAYLNKLTAIYNNYFIMPTTLNIFIESISIFIYFTNIDLQFKTISSTLIKEIGMSSIYIYLFHPILILVMKNVFKINLFAGNLYIKSLISICIVLFLTISISIIFNEIPSIYKRVWKKIFHKPDNNIL